MQTRPLRKQKKRAKKQQKRGIEPVPVLIAPAPLSIYWQLKYCNTFIPTQNWKIIAILRSYKVGKSLRKCKGKCYICHTWKCYIGTICHFTSISFIKTCSGQCSLISFLTSFGGTQEGYFYQKNCKTSPKCAESQKNPSISYFLNVRKLRENRAQ